MILAQNKDAVGKALSHVFDDIVKSCSKCGGMDMSCICRARMILYEKAAHAGVPISLWTKRISSYGVGQEDNPAVVEVKEQWMEIVDRIEDLIKRGMFMVVTGPNGTGKTMLSCIALKAALTAGKTGQYVLFTQLIDMYHEPYSDSKSQKMDWVTSCDLLIIDEVGKEYKRLTQGGEIDNISNMASYSRYVIESVTKCRSDARLSTIMISNDTVDEIEKKYGGVDSALSSIMRSPNTFVMYHSGIDYRSVHE